MNIFSRKLGLANTQFINETGLDINSETEAGAISSAEDITKIDINLADHKPSKASHIRLNDFWRTHT